MAEQENKRESDDEGSNPDAHKDKIRFPFWFHENWAKANFALLQTRDGLQDFVETNVIAMHNEILEELYKTVPAGTVCSQCTTVNLTPCPNRGACRLDCRIHDQADPARCYRPCPNNVCNKFMNLIAMWHRSVPMWKNTDATQWFRNAWEVAKCFMPHGYYSSGPASEVDISGFLSIIINMKRIPTEIMNSDWNIDAYEEVRSIRNMLMHSANPDMSNAELQDIIHSLIRALSNGRYLESNKTAQEAVNRLEELMPESLSHTWKKETPRREAKVRNEAEQNLIKDPKMADLFMSTLANAEEEQTSIRMMLIGHSKVGKTTLTSNILQIPQRNKRTNGIDVHVYHAREVNGKLEFIDKPEGESMKRLAYLAKTRQNESCSSSTLGESVNSTKDSVVSKPGVGCSSTVNIIYSSEESNVTSEIPGMNRGKSETSSSVLMSVPSSSCNLDEFGEAYQAGSEVSRMLSIWDFGGQFCFYVTHQLFLSSDAVYLLLVDLTKDLDTEVADTFSSDESRDVESYVRFWLETIHAFVGNSDGNPPVILVGTHFDKLENEPSKEQKAKKKLQNVRNLFKGSPVGYHIHHEQFWVTKEPSPEEIDKIMTCVTKLAMKQERTKIPANWIPLENRLMEMKTGKTWHITFEDLCEIDQKMPIPIADRDKLKVFLIFQHRKGNLIYFPDGILSSIIVLNPQWIVDAFKCIITAEEFCDCRPNLMTQWDELKINGILRPSLVKAVWEGDELNDFAKYQHVLLLFLQQLRVISKEYTKNKDETEKVMAGNSEQNQQESHFIVPCKLRRDACCRIKQLEKATRSKTLIFAFYFRNGFVPATLYHKIIAAAVAQWELFEWGGETMVFINGTVFKMDPNHVGVITLNSKSIEINVLGLIEADIKIDLSDRLRRFVHSIISEELGRLRDGSLGKQYALAARCDSLSCSCPTYHLWDEIKDKHESVACSGSKQFHGINVDQFELHWFPFERCRVKLVDLMRKHPSGDAFLTKEISDKDIVSVAYRAIESLDHLGKALGISSGEMDRLEKNYQSMNTKIQRMITKWRKESKIFASWQVFLELLDSHPNVKVNRDHLLNIFDSLDVPPQVI